MHIPKILTILPYKENYTKSKAQAAAIWVYDFLKYSRYKKNTIIVGNGVSMKDSFSINFK